MLFICPRRIFVSAWFIFMKYAEKKDIAQMMSQSGEQANIIYVRIHTIHTPQNTFSFAKPLSKLVKITKTISIIISFDNFFIRTSTPTTGTT